jgi:hypothetical protein
MLPERSRVCQPEVKRLFGLVDNSHCELQVALRLFSGHALARLEFPRLPNRHRYPVVPSLQMAAETEFQLAGLPPAGELAPGVDSRSEGVQHGDGEDWPAPARGAGPRSLPDRARRRALRRFYADIFGGEVVLEKNPVIVKVSNSWAIMNPGPLAHSKASSPNLPATA